MSRDPAAPAYTTLRFDVAEAIATITLDRPEALNALTVPMKTELLAAFGVIARDRAVRAVVLTGAGRAFCAGQDLKERLEPGAAPLEVEVRERYNPIIAAMRGLDRPIVGAINGVAAGAGASVAFACDIRLAAEGASFILGFARIGLVPDSGATWFLPRLVGPAKAAELALLGDSLSAADAERFGLVARVVRADALAGEARAVAARLRRAPAPGTGPHQAGARAELVRRPRCGARGRGVSAGDRRGHEGSRRGPRRLHREAAASVHRGVAGDSSSPR